MSIQDFITFLKGLGLTAPLYPNAFPATAPIESMMLEVGQGLPARGTVSEITLTVTVRAEHMGRAEALSQQVIDLLKEVTDEPIGESGQIVLIKSQQLVPSFLGQSADGKYYYMNNFRVLVND